MRIGSWAFALVSLGAIVPALAADYTVSKVALSNEIWNSSNSFNLFGTPSVDGAGNVTFTAILNTNNHSGMWSLFNGVKTTVLDQLTLTDDASGANGLIGYAGFNDSLGKYEIRVGAPNAISGAGAIVTQIGNAAPGTVSTFNGLNDPVINGTGQAAFVGYYGASGSGVWRGIGGGTPSKIALASELQVNSTTIDSITSTRMNGSGVTVFAGILPSNAGVDLVDGIWTGTPGTVTQIAQIDGTYIGYGRPTINNAGTVAFGAVTATGESILKSTGGVISTLVSSNQTAPGIGKFDTFRITDGSAQPNINNTGRVAFYATLKDPIVGTIDSTNDESLWESTPSGLQLMAREGDLVAVPALSGVRFTAGTVVFPDSVAINASGQAAFLTGLQADEVGEQRIGDAGIFVWNPDGSLSMVARVGDTLAAAGGRTILSLNLLQTNSGGEDGFYSAFNDSGEVAFQAQFTDNTQGVFFADVSAVPEPGTLAVLGLGVVGLLGRRRA